MGRYLKTLVFLAAIGCVALAASSGWAAERRLALVIGNAAYKAKPLATAVNDASLVAQTLQLSGFEVMGARDLDLPMLRKAFHDFADQVGAAGPDATVVVYFSGYAAQLGGENYLIPVNTELSDSAELSNRAVPLSELTHLLATLQSKASFVVLDAARPGPFLLAGQAGGLAWVEPEANMLIAFSAAPGTLARDAANGYGPYAKALAEMIREGDLTPTNLFYRVRLRVHESSRGGQVPWEFSRIKTPFKFFERTPAAPPRTDAPARTAQFRLQPMRVLGAQNAYMTALMRDTFDSYTDYLADFWQEPTIKRIRALLAARRESITWQRTCHANDPAAYWSYLERYPQGPHVADAGRFLKRLGAASALPAKFARLDYDVPPPTPDELEYVERPLLMLDDPALGLDAAPSTPAVFLEQMPQELLNLKPVVSSGIEGFALPLPSLPLPAYVRLPDELKEPSVLPKGTQQASVTRPAIDAPVPLQSQKDMPSSSTQSLTSASDAAKGRPASPGDDEITQKKGTPVANSRQEKAAETSRSASLSPLTSAMSDLGMRPADHVTETSHSDDLQQKISMGPFWLRNSLSDRGRLHSSTPFPIDSSTATSAPSMFASASSGLTFQTWQQKSLRGSIPIAHASPRRTLAPKPISVTGPVRTTGAIPRAPSAHIVNGGPTRQAVGPLEQARVENEAKPRQKPAPSNQTVRDRREPLATIPADPQ